MVCSISMTRAIFLLAGTMFMASCSRETAASSRFVRDLEKAASALKSEQKLQMSALHGESWNRLFVFAPYTSTETISHTTGVQSSEQVVDARLYEREDIHLLIFFRGSTYQLVAEVPRAAADFSPSVTGRAIDRETALFVKNAEGKLELAP